MAIDLDFLFTADMGYRYQMLSRFKQDCDYFLGNGGRNEKYLWAGNVSDQIDVMKRTWDQFSEEDKPEWLTWEDILDYEDRMFDN